MQYSSENFVNIYGDFKPKLQCFFVAIDLCATNCERILIALKADGTLSVTKIKSVYDKSESLDKTDYFSVFHRLPICKTATCGNLQIFPFEVNFRLRTERLQMYFNEDLSCQKTSESVYKEFFTTPGGGLCCYLCNNNLVSKLK